jgi:hypothetical protein
VTPRHPSTPDNTPNPSKATRCAARRSRDGQPCRRWAIPGLRVCASHGGSAPQARAAAARRVAEAKAAAVLNTWSSEPVADPLGELQRLAGEVVGWKNLLAGRVAELTQMRYEGRAGEQLRAEVALFERALDRCERVLSSMARLNIDERLAVVSETQGRALARVVDAVLADLELGPAEARRARESAARHLRAIGGGS